MRSEPDSAKTLLRGWHSKSSTLDVVLRTLEANVDTEGVITASSDSHLTITLPSSGTIELLLSGLSLNSIPPDKTPGCIAGVEITRGDNKPVCLLLEMRKE